MPAKMMDERRTRTSASSDSEHHTLPDRESAEIIRAGDFEALTGDFEAHRRDNAGMEEVKLVSSLSLSGDEYIPSGDLRRLHRC